MRVWRDVVGYKGRYQVSDDGRVRSLLTNRVLKPALISSGYPAVVLRKAGASRTTYVHRLVAMSFIRNPHRRRTVNHLDGRLTNNRKCNLEWATYSQNHLHAYRHLGRRAHEMPVSGTFADGKVRRFDSVTKAAIYLGVTKTAVSAVLCGRSKSCGGASWKAAR